MNKIRYDLLPNYGVSETNKVFTEKLNKYQKNKWKYGLSWTEVLNSLKYHLSEFELGHDYNKEGLLNIAEVAMNALILAEFYHTYPQGDDRLIAPLNKPIVALDIDDVCLDFLGAFEKRFGYKLNPYWNGSYQISDQLKELQKDKDFWVNLPVLNKPSFEPDLYITSRSIPIEWTMESLEKNGFPCAPVYAVPWNESKVALLKEHSVDILIDDKIQNFREATENGVFCYLMDAPHNKYYDVGHRRIKNLKLNIK